jgi:tetratricopeptide (TPR) repeat protein
MSLLRAAWALGLAALLVGCQQSAPPPPAATPAVDDMASARAAMARSDYTAALPLLQSALAANPNNFEARYRLGVTASYLDLFDEARTAFQWVVAHGAPSSSEVRVARDWLAHIPRAEAPAATPAKAEEEPRPDRANVSGKVLGEAEGGGMKPLVRQQILLRGAPNTPVKDEWHILRTEPDGSYRFSNVPPGDYMITDKVAGPPGWRLKVTLKAGDKAVLDLNPQNSSKSRDDFPGYQ